MPDGPEKKKAEQNLQSRYPQIYKAFVEENVDSDESITIASRIPTTMNLQVSMDTKVPVGKEDFEKEQSSEDAKMIYVEGVKPEKAAQEEAEEDRGKQKKQWAATFTFTQSDKAG